MIEVTTFRRDVRPLGRRSIVEFADQIDDDLARRDFTINAIAWHPLREELLDPFGGRADLKNKVLRAVGDPHARFAEDYLRVLRAFRFAGRFGLHVEADSWQGICQASPRLGILSPERVREELMKVLSGLVRPSEALELYRTSGALPVLYPELGRVAGLTAAVGSEPWAQTLRLVDGVPRYRPWLRLAALLRWIGLPAPDPDQGEEGLDQEGRAGRRCAQLLARLRFSNAQTDGVTHLVAAPPMPVTPSGPDLRKWLSTVGRERVNDVLRLHLREARTAPASDGVLICRRCQDLRSELRRNPPLTEQELAIDGRDLIALGMKPGPRFGDLLAHLLALVLEEPERNEREALLAAAQEYGSSA